MKKKSSLLLSLALLSTSFMAHAQTNSIRLKVTPNDYQNYTSKSKKYIFTSPSADVNGQGPLASKLETRGQSCIGASRRCFGLDISAETKLFLNNSENEIWKTDDMVLASMGQDTGYINNRIGFAFTKRMGLPTVKSTYAEVSMNGYSLGLYLAQQKPHKLAKKAKSGFIGRRREAGNIELKKYFPKNAKYPLTTYIESFDYMYSVAKNPKGVNLYNFLSRRMNLDKYFKLLTLHSMLKNGDYTDELFFYAVNLPQGIYFDIIPWDFEDLFAAPHPTRANKKAMKKGWFNESILYSFEDPLDKAIFENRELHDAFKRTAKNYLNTVLTEALIDDSINEVKAAINPYLDNNRIFILSTRDEASRGSAYTKYGILNLLEIRRSEIKSRRLELLRRL